MEQESFIPMTFSHRMEVCGCRRLYSWPSLRSAGTLHALNSKLHPGCLEEKSSPNFSPSKWVPTLHSAPRSSVGPLGFYGCILVPSGCYDKNPVAWVPINHRHLCPTALEAGCPGSRHRQIQCRVRPLPGSQTVSSPCVLSRGRARDTLGLCFKGTNSITGAPHDLLTSQRPLGLGFVNWKKNCTT